MTVSASDNIRLIEEFFHKYTSSGLGMVLPDGWPGRPFDNYCQLVSISQDANDLTHTALDLGQGLRLVVGMIAVEEPAAGVLQIHVNGGMLSMAERVFRFGKGIVTFLRQSMYDSQWSSSSSAGPGADR